MHVKEDRLTGILNGVTGKKIAVIGDVMLDQYFWGRVARVSPEAPVPVVEVNSESVRLGGAANVANNIAALGGVPVIVGLIGNDHNGSILKSLTEDAGFSTEGLIVDASRPTTIKTRIIAHNQHVVRYDRESTQYIDEGIARKIIDFIQSRMSSIDGIILQDYNKGIFTESIIRTATTAASKREKLITVDPKFNNFFSYTDVTVFKPNRRELEQAFGVKLSSNAEFEKYGHELVKRLRAGNVLITRGEQGMTLVEKNGEVIHVPTRTRSVADVSGAGDTVIATLTAVLAAGATVRESATIANFAGGIVCEEIGIVPVARDRLVDTMVRYERTDGSGSREAEGRHG
jgi:D-glycero-beta-D-manno-heptose-7-phosphate kinase